MFRHCLVILIFYAAIYIVGNYLLKREIDWITLSSALFLAYYVNIFVNKNVSRDAFIAELLNKIDATLSQVLEELRSNQLTAQDVRRKVLPQFKEINTYFSTLSKSIRKPWLPHINISWGSRKKYISIPSLLENFETNYRKLREIISEHPDSFHTNSRISKYLKESEEAQLYCKNCIWELKRKFFS